MLNDYDEIKAIRGRLEREFLAYSAENNNWEGVGTVCDPFVRVEWDAGHRLGWELCLHTRYHYECYREGRPDYHKGYQHELYGIECEVRGDTELEAWQRFEQLVRMAYWAEANEKQLGYNIYTNFVRVRKRLRHQVHCDYMRNWATEKRPLVNLDDGLRFVERYTLQRYVELMEQIKGALCSK